MRRVFLPAALLALAGCAQFPSAPAVVVQPTLNWRSMATESDRDRLRDWRSAFVDGLRSARAAGHSAEIERETAGLLNYVAYPAFDCRIQQAGYVQDFAKLTGSQRQVGSIFPGDALRQVFLGTLVLGDEARAMQYGRDTERDVAGYVERIGPSRWRMIMPRPHFESQMDVMELVPSSFGVR